MRRAMLLVAALGACASSLPQVLPGEAGTFVVRFNAEHDTIADADARAAAYCSGRAAVQSQETRHDGLQYRTYRCEAE